SCILALQHPASMPQGFPVVRSSLCDNRKLPAASTATQLSRSRESIQKLTQEALFGPRLPIFSRTQ
ncbi:hypothetical protein GGH99_005135, partial [Coemansia sp. RSA 1285]